ncbi:UNVERIFIED_CONTAM: Histone-lysine N-methyltransferase SETMAR [Trichonephila clavipes]
MSQQVWRITKVCKSMELNKEWNEYMYISMTAHRRENGVDARILSSYDFKVGLNQAECFQWLQLVFGDESPCSSTVFRWFKEFCSGHNSLQDEERARKLWPAVIPDNVSAIRKMLMDDNRCTYQTIQKELNFGSAAIYKIIHVELLMEKVPHNLTEHQKEERVTISKKNPLNCQRMVATESFQKL